LNFLLSFQQYSETSKLAKTSLWIEWE